MAMTWAWGLTDLDQSQTLVLLALADAANDEGVCWPSQAEIGRKARLKDRAVRNQIRSLEAAGLLSVSRRATPQGRKTNVYRLNIGCDFSLQSKQPARNAGWVEGSEPEPVDNPTFRCNQSNRHEMPVGHPTGTVMPVATGTVMPVASIYQTPNIQTPNPTQPSPALKEVPGSGQVGSGVIQDDLSAQGAVPGSADADAEAVTARGELAAEMLAAGENPTRMVAEGWWNAGELAEALAWAAEHPALETTQQHQENAPQVTRQERDHVDEASALIGACLPKWMQALDRAGARQVAGMLAERIAAGWTPAQIRSVMGEMPRNGIKRMSGLVAYRLDENVGVADAPQARTAAARQAQEAAINAAHHAQAVAIDAEIDAAKTPEERAREEAHKRMWEHMCAAYPQASKAELVGLVHEAMNQMNDLSDVRSA